METNLYYLGSVFLSISETSPIATNSACVKLERCTVADLMSKTQHCSSKNITDYVEHVFQVSTTRCTRYTVHIP